MCRTIVFCVQVKVGVVGAEECGEMEEWFNYRMCRAAPDVCAKYLGSFRADVTRGQFTEGGKWLIWKYEVYTNPLYLSRCSRVYPLPQWDLWSGVGCFAYITSHVW